MAPSDLERLLDDPLPFLPHDDPAVRRLALAACVGRLDEDDVRAAVADRLVEDEDASVRAAAAELLGGAGEAAFDALMKARSDGDDRVVEAVVSALGELAIERAVPYLLDTARNHSDRLVREAAVAALGAVGDDTAVPLLLDLLATGPPQVRRRAAVALTAFDDPAIEPALRRAREDRNPMVREVVEMIVGREPPDDWEPIRLPTEQ